MIAYRLKDHWSGTERLPAHGFGRDAMSSPEELTLVVGRGLRPTLLFLYVVYLVGLAPTSRREQVRTKPDRRFGRASFYRRSEP
jgi:hypothetical protein